MAGPQTKEPDPASLRKSTKLTLKGGQPWGVSKKKKKPKARAKPPEEGEETAEEQPQILGVDGKPIDPKSVAVQSGKTYEEEFALQMEKAKEGKVKNTPWGSSYRAPNDILHGYDAPIKKFDTAEKRLDLRCAVKTDKFCK
ncbi:hypothetical protein WJX73_004232 [Symbiochloris irregularis]|uniref:Uncharacterized protein n=1 Tax=Symbiochloris irregularis TaxID=706552 RepID=A0AAW1PGK4_9CHLO